jgi:hypothetical protein
VRKILTTDKVLEKYVRNVEITEDELREAYRKDNGKVKLSFINIPFSRFDNEVTLTDEEIENFYQNNKDLFRQSAKIKINYIILDKEKNAELITEISDKIDNYSTIESLAKDFSLNVMLSPYLEETTPLAGISWEQTINDLAFNIPQDKLSPMLELSDSYIIFEKTEHIQGQIEDFQDVKSKAQELLTNEKRKALAKALAEELLKKITKKETEDIKELAKEYNLAIETTDYLKYSEIAQTLKVAAKINESAFNLKPGEIPDEIFLGENGYYIIKLEDILPFSEDKFNEEKESYRINITTKKVYYNYLDFTYKLQQKLNLKLLK